MGWSKDDTFKFVELYCDHECLWNMTKPQYKNRNMRQKAVEDIVQAFGRASFGVAEVKQKIKNIRSTYNQEVRKIKHSARSGACPDSVYQPNVKWFGMMDQIMKGVKQLNDAKGNLDLLVELELESEQAEEKVETLVEPSIEQKPVRRSHPVASSAGKPRALLKRSFRESAPAVTEFCAVNEMQNWSEPPKQENEAFGRYVSSVLDTLPQREAIMAQSEIQDILTRYRLSMIAPPTNYASCTPNHSFSPSNHSSES